MEFVSGFPLTQQKHDSVWVIFDKLTKSAHFIPVRMDVRLHGVPLSIVLDRDQCFTSRLIIEGTIVSLGS